MAATPNKEETKRNAQSQTALAVCDDGQKCCWTVLCTGTRKRLVTGSPKRPSTPGESDSALFTGNRKRLVTGTPKRPSTPGKSDSALFTGNRKRLVTETPKRPGTWGKWLGTLHWNPKKTRHRNLEETWYQGKVTRHSSLELKSDSSPDPRRDLVLGESDSALLTGTRKRLVTGTPKRPGTRGKWLGTLHWNPKETRHRNPEETWYSGKVTWHSSLEPERDLSPEPRRDLVLWKSDSSLFTGT